MNDKYNIQLLKENGIGKKEMREALGFIDYMLETEGISLCGVLNEYDGHVMMIAAHEFDDEGVVTVYGRGSTVCEAMLDARDNWERKQNLLAKKYEQGKGQ